MSFPTLRSLVIGSAAALAAAPACAHRQSTALAEEAGRSPSAVAQAPGEATPAQDPTLATVGEAPPDDDGTALAAATRSTLATSLDFTVDLLPPLRYPLAGAPELEHVEPEASARPIAPITAHARDLASPSLHLSLAASPARLATLEDGSAVDLHIDGLPGTSSTLPGRVAPAQPTSVDPNEFSMGARWAVDDRIRAPLLDSIDWHAQADVATGAAPDRGSTVIRRSLRLTAQWDRPEDFSLGVTQGVQVGGGTAYDHYATGVTASLFDTPPSPFAHWSTFVELTGEHLALGDLAQNSAATVNAGAAFKATSSTDLQLSVSRGLAPAATTQSNVGLSVKF